MISKTLLLFFYLSIVISIQVDLSQQCTCKQYENDMCDLDAHCSQNSNQCGNLICSNKSKDFCTGINTYFKCEYDLTSNTCKDKTYTCNDLNEKYCSYSSLFGMNCVWSVNKKCEDFNCSIAKECPNACAFKNEICSTPTDKIDCSTISYSQCTLMADGFGQVCLRDNENQCESYDAEIDCSEWNDQPLTICLILGCTYQGSKCRNPICSDISSQGSCTQIYYKKQNQINICKWDGKYCSDASEDDISKFSLLECLQNTFYTYTWQNNKCVKCSDISNPGNQTNNNNQSENNSSNNQNENNSSNNQSGNNDNIQRNITSKINIDNQLYLQLDIKIGSWGQLLVFSAIYFIY